TPTGVTAPTIAPPPAPIAPPVTARWPQVSPQALTSKAAMDKATRLLVIFILLPTPGRTYAPAHRLNEVNVGSQCGQGRGTLMAKSGVLRRNPPLFAVPGPVHRNVRSKKSTMLALIAACTARRSTPGGSVQTSAVRPGGQGAMNTRCSPGTTLY